MVVFDNTMLLLTLFPGVPVPTDPATNLPITDAAARVEYLLKTLDARRERVAIPAPVLSEVLIRAGANMGAYLTKFQKSAMFRIESFDARAAVEVALMAQDAISIGDKKDGSDEVWAKVKYDRQIIAIAKVIGASAIYSDDKGVKRTAVRVGMPVIGLLECPLLPIDA
jgi:predicted nucleic acid-binding protein